MTTLRQINEFIESQPIALVGVSRNPKKFGYSAFKELKEKGMKVIPVNPEADEIMGVKSYRNVTQLPPEVKGIIVFTKKDKTASVVREAKAKGIKQIWIQQMADSKEALDELKGSDINVVTGECILMHYKANSIHKFHRAIVKLFGRLPK
jgi:predicted CoA-binding protein